MLMMDIGFVTASKAVVATVKLLSALRAPALASKSRRRSSVSSGGGAGKMPRMSVAVRKFNEQFNELMDEAAGRLASAMTSNYTLVSVSHHHPCHHTLFVLATPSRILDYSGVVTPVLFSHVQRTSPCMGR